MRQRACHLLHKTCPRLHPFTLSAHYYRRGHRSYCRAMSTGSAESPTYKYVSNVEDINRYRPGGYHPIEISDKLNQRYSIVDKLGHGGYSTIWLARDEKLGKYVVVKVGAGNHASNECDVLRKLSACPAREFSGCLVPPVLDEFSLIGPNGTHCCIVTAPAKCSVAESLQTSSYMSFRPDVARALAAQLVIATAYVHRSGFVHGGKCCTYQLSSSRRNPLTPSRHPPEKRFAPATRI